MSNLPTISIIIPAYNAERFIHITLDSIRAQTYKDYEVIVVDDGSQDKTWDTVESYMHHHGLPGCCIRQANKGIAGARNTGLATAKGEWIALLDHDDTWYPPKLERIMTAARLHPEAGLISHHLRMIKNGKEIGIIKTGPASKKMYEDLLFTPRGNLLTPSAATFKKAMAIEIGGFCENPEFNTSEDFDFWLRLCQVTEFYFLDETLGTYLILESGASKKIVYHHQNMEVVLRDHFNRYLSSHPGWRGRLRMRRRLAILYRTAVHNLLKQKASPEFQKEYLIKMLKTYPFSLKNMVVTALWILKH